MEDNVAENQYFEKMEQFIRKSLFPHEIELLDQVLIILKMTLLDVLLKGKELFKEQPPTIKSTEIPDFLNKIGLWDKIATFNEEEKIIFEKFGQTVAYKIPKIIEEFFAETLNEKNALEFSKNSLQNYETLFERVEEELEDNKFEKYLVKRKRQVEILEKTVQEETSKKIKLVWNDRYDLKKFSEALNDKGIVNEPLEFINIFKNQSVCIIKKEMIDFFVVLIYELLKRKPAVILSEKKSGKGVKSIIDLYFRDNSIAISKTISFRNRYNRIVQRGLEYDKMKEKVNKFLNNHL